MGTASQHRLLVPLRGGRLDYIFGCHPIWELFRCVYQTTRPPIVIGGLLRFSGFVWAGVTRVEKKVPLDVVRFRRQEQLNRLTQFLGRCLRLNIHRSHAR